MSSSWVQEKETGFRVFEIYNDFSVGKILDPTRVEINCLYPADASAAGRDNHGCGPLSNDPQHGSIGTNRFYRTYMQYKIAQLKNELFGSNTSWTNISCSDFLGPITEAVGHNVSYVRHRNNRDKSVCSPTDDGAVSYETYESFVSRVWQSFMGHPVCVNETDTVPDLTANKWLLYEDECWWEPQAWSSMMSIMRKIRTSSDVRIWNELVLSKPRKQPDVIQAVFYLIKPNMNGDNIRKAYEIAKKQATKWKKPLLKVDLTAYSLGTHDIFTCNQSAAVMESHDLLRGNTALVS